MRLAVIASALAVCLLVFSGCGDDEAKKRAVARAQEAEQNASHWKTVAFVVSIGAVVLLVVGSALGSSARKHAQK